MIDLCVFCKLFYKFDDGPNPVLFVEDEDLLHFLEFLYNDPICIDVSKQTALRKDDTDYVITPFVPFVSTNSEIYDKLNGMLEEKYEGGKNVNLSSFPSSLPPLQRITHTTPGPSPWVSLK
jgi:hypothetical protein